jgi:hypothetical protein
MIKTTNFREEATINPSIKKHTQKHFKTNIDLLSYFIIINTNREKRIETLQVRNWPTEQIFNLPDRLLEIV